jgi:hypothetical protein
VGFLFFTVAADLQKLQVVHPATQFFRLRVGEVAQEESPVSEEYSFTLAFELRSLETSESSFEIATRSNYDHGR